MKQTLHGPDGIRIVLDSDQIVPDDPGQGTPAMVECKGYTGTYWCAKDTGELDCGEYVLTDRQAEWLAGQERRVNKFIETKGRP